IDASRGPQKLVLKKDGGSEDDLVTRGHRWRGEAGAVAQVTFAQFGGHILCGRALDLLLIETALLAYYRIGVEENLQVGVGKNLGADVASFHDDPADDTQFALLGRHPLTDFRMHGHARSGLGHVSLANARGNIVAIEQPPA